MKPEESLYFLQAAQALARYHQALGIDHYPTMAKLSALTQTPQPNAKRIDPNPPDQTRWPVTPHLPPPSPQHQQALSAGTGQPVAMASTDLVANLQNCRLCAASDIEPLTAQAGRIGQAVQLFVVGDYQHGAKPGGDFIFGQEEDELLAKMLAAIALNDEDVGISNLIKCRPATNKATVGGPDEAVAERCLAHLCRQLLTARPRLILAMGDLPARILTGKNASLSALRGRLHNFFPREDQPVPVLVSYHPAFLLAQTEMKIAAWADLKMARRFLASLPLTIRTARH